MHLRSTARRSTRGIPVWRIGLIAAAAVIVGTAGSATWASEAVAAEAVAAANPAAPEGVEVALKSRDGHAFKGLYLAPASDSSNAVLLVPDLGQKRDHFLRLARSLRDRGYRVLAIDNTGQVRQVERGPNKTPVFKPLSTKILAVLVQDVMSGLEVLRGQPGVGRVAILGFGIGANVGLLTSGKDPAIEAMGAVVPSYGCEDFDAYSAFGNMNARPVLLLESRKRYQTDISSAFEHIMEKRRDLPFSHVMLKRDADAVTKQELEADYEESVLAWIGKAFPTAAH